MRIAIATTTLDPYGDLALNANVSRSNFGEFRRRVTRVATLDLGVAFTDTGYTDADRTVTLDISDESEANVEAAQWITKYHSRIMLFLPDGAFAAVPEYVNSNNGRTTFRLLLAGEATVNG